MESVELAEELTKRLGVLICDFKDDGASQPQLETTLHEYVALLAKLSKIEDRTPIPLALLQHIDSGRHPDSYLQQRLVAVQEESKRAHGKDVVLMQFREELRATLAEDAQGEFKAVLQTMERKPKLVKLSMPTHLIPGDEEEIIDI
ncbi:Mediator of RNA polymerase II transcription subunit 10 [Paramicrosporidium saccamoebae]|uniref:Mediator of RNA polymerase II transcription subunit 10 n=1 Tax=Paramicrosporidium saccamoebae TaxID=1246581 RepID=A0A2H9TJQ2_9FUNG|nr:Mediator of RNA polymerase II transcription subunit 10 [Paramicrosporidium saccamoebae]